jgi:A/G-specific adenine glycosylase
MMDLGATICTPRDPKCGACPLRLDCAAFASGEPEQFPMPKARKIRPNRYGTAYWTECDGCVWLVRRPAKGLLGGMAALPGAEWTEADQRTGTAVATIRHVFTHFALQLDVIVRDDPFGDGWWQPLSGLAEAGLPTLFAKAVQAVLDSEARLAA